MSLELPRGRLEVGELALGDEAAAGGEVPLQLLGRATQAPQAPPELLPRLLHLPHPPIPSKLSSCLASPRVPPSRTPPQRPR